MKLKIIVALVLAAASLCGQTILNGDRQMLGKWDASGATATLPFQAGLLSARPATCAVGQVYFANNVTAGQNLYLCTAANTWTQMTGTGGVGTAAYTCSISTTGTAAQTCNDSLGTLAKIVSCYDASTPPHILGPGTTTQVSDYTTTTNTTVISFTGSTTGTCYVVNANNMGPAGNSGSNGAAATVSVGTVTTGVAGSSATVVNGGTSGAAVLNFTIPRGSDGAGAGDVAAAGNNVMSGYTDFHSGRWRYPEATFASAPGTPLTGQTFLFTDAVTDGTCSGGGTAFAQCRYSGSAWVSVGGGSGGGGASYNQSLVGAGPLGSGANNSSRTQRAAVQARDNLSFDDDGTNTILNFTPLDARTVNMSEEFFGAVGGLSGVFTFTYPWRLFPVAGSNVLTQVSGGDAWPNLGVTQIVTGATSGNGFAMALTNNSGMNGALGALGANAGWGYLWIFKLSAATSVRLRIGTGIIDSVTTFDRVGMFGVRYDTNQSDTNFQFFVNPVAGGSNGGANDVLIDTTVAGDTAWHTALVYSTVTGTVRMSLDGGAEKTFCSSGCDATVTIPTVQMDPLAQMLTDTSSARTLFLDAFKFKARVATGTANKRN